MQASELNFLKTLLETGSPSGYESEIQQKIRSHVEPFADRIDRDWHGNLAATVNPSGSPRIMLAGHCDQIGLQVKFIEALPASTLGATWPNVFKTEKRKSEQ